MDLPNPRVEPRSLTLQRDSLPAEPIEKQHLPKYKNNFKRKENDKYKLQKVVTPRGGGGWVSNPLGGGDGFMSVSYVSMLYRIYII